jgi:DNA-binding transcriptional LysR family regulator
MAHLNLKHLRYFWAVATHGSIGRAGEILHLTPQTISGQLAELERQVGAKLFSKDGRGLAPTETGRMVFSYADEMFRLEGELRDLPGGGARYSLSQANCQGFVGSKPHVLPSHFPLLFIWLCANTPMLGLEDPSENRRGSPCWFGSWKSGIRSPERTARPSMPVALSSAVARAMFARISLGTCSIFCEL